MTEDLLLKLYSQPQTVFTIGELSLLFPEISYPNLRRRLSYFSGVGKVKKLRQGIYAKGKYNPLELANKLYNPSYISLETVLEKEGVVFQHYETISVISYLTRRINVSGYNIFYRKIKDSVLLNREGIEEKEGFSIASLERAFLDAIFLYKDYHFDNLKPINWEKAMRLQEIYYSKRLKKRLKEYHALYDGQY